MDQGTGDSMHYMQGQSMPLTNTLKIKVELPWSMKEEPPDQPSAVYSPMQPLSDSTSGSQLPHYASHVCQRCSAVFMLSRSLKEHMEIFHGETPQSESPVLPRLGDSAEKNTDKMPSGQDRFSTQITDDYQADSATSSADFVIKLEPAWSLKEDPPDQPLPGHSPAQPMADRGTGWLLPPTSSPVCQRCSATFLLLSSLELHALTFHGETLPDSFPLYSACKGYGASYRRGSSVGDRSRNSAEKGRENQGQNAVVADQRKKKSRKHVCDVCGKAFIKISHLKAHKLIHTGHKPFVCDVCDKAFTQAGTMKQHRLIHAGHKPFVCDVCSKAFSHGGRLKEHMMLHTGQKPFACDVCNRTFCKAGNLKMHKLTHSGIRPFVCDVCSKAFTLAGTLKTHKLLHSVDTSFMCDICSEAFPEFSMLRAHKLIHRGQKKFVCEVCDKGFAQSGHLKEHKLTHTGEKPYACGECNKAFARIGDLNMHKVIHTGRKPFVCDVCAKAFYRAAHLKRHKVMHTSERPFVCETCNRAFSRAPDLKTHMLIHTGERPHVCEVCTRGFAHRSALKRHKALHLEERIYKCPLCKIHFNGPGHLEEHTRSVHEDKHQLSDVCW